MAAAAAMAAAQNRCMLRADWIDIQKPELQRMYRAMVAGIELLPDGAFKDDTARGFRDVVSNALGKIKREADNAGTEPSTIRFDTEELDQIIAGLK